MVTKQFIDPVALQKALTPVGKLAVQHFEPNLGPSAPHADDEDDATPGLGFPNWRDWLPDGMPKHYTEGLDDLWAEYDDPDERTAARLQVLLDEVADEALRVHLLSVELFEKTPTFKLSLADRDRFHKEFIAYGKRLNGYRERLAMLEPGSIDTDAVYVGLVQSREGTGPVPDAIMHMYFANQLGILADHADDMGTGFMGRTLGALDKLERAAIDASDVVSDQAEAAAMNWSAPLRTIGWVIAGVLAAGAVVVGGVLAFSGTRRAREREAS